MREKMLEIAQRIRDKKKYYPDVEEGELDARDLLDDIADAIEEVLEFAPNAVRGTIAQTSLSESYERESSPE